MDDIFLTSNGSLEQLCKILEEAKKYHPNIKFIYEIGSSVSFLDVQVTNRNGHLITSVHHKQAAEPYVVPYKSDHPRHIFENIIQTALVRAIRYSSTLTEFNHERCRIKLMLLYNGYGIRYPARLLSFQFYLLGTQSDIFIVISRNSSPNIPFGQHLFYQ